MKHLASKEQNRTKFWLNCFKKAYKNNCVTNILYTLESIELPEKEVDKAIARAKKRDHKTLGNLLIDWKAKNRVLNKPMFQKNKTLKLKEIKIPDKALVANILAFKGNE